MTKFKQELLETTPRIAVKCKTPEQLRRISEWVYNHKLGIRAFEVNFDKYGSYTEYFPKSLSYCDVSYYIGNRDSYGPLISFEEALETKTTYKISEKYFGREVKSRIIDDWFEELSKGIYLTDLKFLCINETEVESLITPLNHISNPDITEMWIPNIYLEACYV